MPGKSVCVLTDKESWPEVSSDAAIGLTLFTPQWYDITQLKIKSPPFGIEQITSQIFDLIVEKAKAEKWVRPKPKNGDGNARAHWDQLHRMRPIGVRYSSHGPRIIDDPNESQRLFGL